MPKGRDNNNNDMMEMENFESFQKRVSTLTTIQDALAQAKTPIWAWEADNDITRNADDPRPLAGNKTIFYKATLDKYGIQKLEPVFGPEDYDKKFGKKGELYDKLADIKENEMLIVCNKLNGANVKSMATIVKHDGKFGVLGGAEIKKNSFFEDIIDFFKNLFRSDEEKQEIRTAKEERHKYNDILSQISLVFDLGKGNSNINLFREQSKDVVEKSMSVASKPAEALHYLVEKSYDKNETLQERAAGMLAFNIYKYMLEPEKTYNNDDPNQVQEHKEMIQTKEKFEKFIKGDNAMENVKLLVENLKQTKMVKDITDEHRLETLRDMTINKPDKDYIYKKSIEEIKKVNRAEKATEAPAKTAEKENKKQNAPSL